MITLWKAIKKLFLKSLSKIFSNLFLKLTPFKSPAILSLSWVKETTSRFKFLEVYSKVDFKLKIKRFNKNAP
jgi:hypothetical protein